MSVAVANFVADIIKSESAAGALVTGVPGDVLPPTAVQTAAAGALANGAVVQLERQDAGRTAGRNADGLHAVDNLEKKPPPTEGELKELDELNGATRIGRRSRSPKQQNRNKGDLSKK